MIKAFEGSPYDGSSDSYRVTAVNTAADSAVGRACLVVPASPARFSQPVGSAGVFMGILQHSHALDTGLITTPDTAWPQNKPGAILRKGRIWVVSESIVASVSDLVYYRHTDVGADPEKFGRFRADDDGGSGDVTQVVAAKWVTTTTAVGQLAVLEINLP